MFDATASVVEHQAGATSSECFPPNGGTVETVAWLLRWRPQQARAYAVAMHELATWQYDDTQTEHWHRVLGLLPK